MVNRNKLLLLLVSLLPLGAVAQIDFFVAAYDQFMVQTASDKLVPFGFRYNNQYGNNFLIEAGIFTSGETISNAKLTGPSFPGGESLEYWPEDPGYGIEAEVQNQDQVAGIITPGTYTFSGMGNTFDPSFIQWPTHAPNLRRHGGFRVWRSRLWGPTLLPIPFSILLSTL